MEKQWNDYFLQEEGTLLELDEISDLAQMGSREIRYREEQDHMVSENHGITVSLASYDRIQEALCSAEILSIGENGKRGPGSHLVTVYFDQEKDSFLHRHECYEIMYVLEGAMREKIDNKAELIRSGDIFIMNPNIEHSEQFQEKAMVVYLQLPESELVPILEEARLQPRTGVFFNNDLRKDKAEFLHYTPVHDEDIAYLIGQIMEEKNGNQAGCRMILRGLTARLLTLLDNENTFERHMYSRELSGTFSMFIQLEKYLEKSRWNIDPEKIREEFHYSEQYLSQIMKKYTGMSISKYCIEHRLSAAEQLLKRTDMSIQDMIEYLGYENKSYFYRIFRQKYGVTPQEYRKNHSASERN